MSSKSYWEKREAEALKRYLQEEQEYQAQLRAIYQNMLDAAQKEIDAFYGRYADKEQITLAEAKRRVSKLDIAAYQRKAKRYVADKDFSKQANEEMRLYNLTMKVNRLEMLKANIGLELVAGHNEQEQFMAKILRGRTEEELQRQAGILGKTVRNNAKLAETIPNASFHGATFSERIRGNQAQMKADLSKLLQQGLIQGKNPRALSKDLRKYYIGDGKDGGAAYAAERLMRTELARVQTEAQKQSFLANGFEMYTFHVNHGCCAACSDLDGKHFKIKDMMPGKNAPPMHPNCRCSVSAYENDTEYEAWLDFLDKGGTTEEWERQKNLLAIAEQNGIIAGRGPADNFDRKMRIYGVDEDLAAVNPNFSTGEYKWQNNCQRCVPTYEMRRRGYRVTAKPIPTKAKDDYIAKDYTCVWENRSKICCPNGSGLQEIKKQMAAWGDGARAEVFVVWKNGDAHVFVAEQINGETVFIDPQNHSADASKYFESVLKGFTSILRIDNNNPADVILDCCDNGGE